MNKKEKPNKKFSETTLFSILRFCAFGCVLSLTITGIKYLAAHPVLLAAIITALIAAVVLIIYLIMRRKKRK